MKKTRKECREDTGYEPEHISNIASKHTLWDEDKKNWTHDQKVAFVYEGLKIQRQKMLGKNQASASNHNCTGSSACFGCERERRNAYASGGNYY